MDGRNFDDLTKKLARAASRRSFFKGLIGGGAAVVGGSVVSPSETSAQQCRGIRHPCEGTQDCCEGLLCIPASFEGQSERCCPPGEQGCGAGCCTIGLCCGAGGGQEV